VERRNYVSFPPLVYAITPIMLVMGSLGEEGGYKGVVLVRGGDGERPHARGFIHPNSLEPALSVSELHLIKVRVTCPHWPGNT
jgi:hypothetical protein